MPRESLDEGVAFGCKFRIADGQGLIDDQDIGVGMGADRECETCRHAARIHFQGLMEESANVGEGGYVGQSFFYGRALHAEDRAADQGIFPAGQFVIETCAECENWRHPAVDRYAPMRRTGDSAKDLQERGLASAIGADNAQFLTAMNLEGDVSQHPMPMIELFPKSKERLFELVVPAQIKLERLADMIAMDGEIR